MFQRSAPDVAAAQCMNVPALFSSQAALLVIRLRSSRSSALAAPEP